MLTTSVAQRDIKAGGVEPRVGVAGGADLFTSLVKPLVVQFSDTYGSGDPFVMLLAGSAQPVVYSRVLTEALLKQCLVLALARCIEHDRSPLPRLTATVDTLLSRAFYANFEQPGVAYTVDSLAPIESMSRSAFATAFRRAFGQLPMSLVKPVRLRRACEILITTAVAVAEVAKRVGISGRSNFSGAFSELHGIAPNCFRRRFLLTEEGLQIR